MSSPTLPESPVFIGREIFGNSSVRPGVVLPIPGTVKPKKAGNVEKAAKEARQANTEFIYFIYQNLQINAKNLDLFLRIKIHITDYLHSKLKARPPLSTVDQESLLMYISNSEFNNIINAVLDSVAKINVPEFDKSIAESIANMILLNNIEKANEDKEKIRAFVDEWTKEKQRKRDEKVRVQRLQEEARRQEELEIAERRRQEELKIAERRQKEELAKATFRQKLEAGDFELREAEARRTMPTTKNITQNIQKNIAASFVTAKRTANAAANAAANRAAAAKKIANAAASVTMAGTAAALRTLVNELVHLSTTYLPKKSFFSSEPVETATYAEIVPHLHAILSTTITDPMRGPDYKANMNSECFKEYLIHNLKKLHEFLIKFKAEISLLEKEVARGQTVKIPVLAEKKEDLQRRIEETAASIAQAITGGVTNTVWRENIEFIEGLPIRFKREDAKTYPKCEAEINKNKVKLSGIAQYRIKYGPINEKGLEERQATAAVHALEVKQNAANFPKRLAANAANIAATPLSYLPTTFPFRNTKKKALYRRLIPKITARVEEILKKYKSNKDAIKREINGQCFKDFLIEYLRTIKNDVLSPEEEEHVAIELATYLFGGCNDSLHSNIIALIETVKDIVDTISATEEADRAGLYEEFNKTADTLTSMLTLYDKQPTDTEVEANLSELSLILVGARFSDLQQFLVRRGTKKGCVGSSCTTTPTLKIDSGGPTIAPLPSVYSEGPQDEGYYKGGRRSHKKSQQRVRGHVTRRGRRTHVVLRGPRTTVSKKNGRRSARRTRRRSSS